MEPIQRAALVRANAAIGVAINDGLTAANRKNFCDLVTGLARAKSLGEVGLFAEHESPVLKDFSRKAMLLGDAVWQGADVAQLVQSFNGSIAPMSLLDQVARWAVRVPPLTTTALLASGFSTDVVTEAAPKAVYNVDLSRLPTEPQKAAGLVVLSQELFGTAAGEAVFLRELEKAALRAQNAALLDIALGASPTTNVAGGATLAGLRNALAASVPSAGYVVALPSAALAVLETFTELRGLERIAFVPHDELPGGTEAVVIAASRVALADHGMSFRPARYATVEMSATPTNPPTGATVVVSLFQQGLAALLVERAFRIAIPEDAVVVLGE